MRNATYHATLQNSRKRIKRQKRIGFLKELVLIVHCCCVMLFIASALSYSIIHW